MLVTRHLEYRGPDSVIINDVACRSTDYGVKWKIPAKDTQFWPPVPGLRSFHNDAVGD